VKVLLNWLREFAPIPGAPGDIGDTMSDLGMAVESMDAVGEGLDGIVVAEVLELRAHPDADKIQLVDVDAGLGEPLQIACGAFNMEVGDKVPLATIGTVMPSGMEIARRKLRGEYSNGMLCSASELGLGSDHGGILVLPADVEVGAPFTDALGLEPDVLYDLEINPNRPDAMSVAGVARDLAARYGVPFAIPTPELRESTGITTAELSSVEIVDPDLCGRFLTRVFRDVELGSSPVSMANRLILSGMRPINRVVDVSNYVMLELGQPNHTYDLDLVAGGHLGTRWARDGERLVTLDGVERELIAADGVIVDRNDTTIGLAGVMGGASTEISDATTSVLLEMAWWSPLAIARTSTRLGLRSEASMRFERGADPEIAELAAARFAELLGAGEVAAGVVDQRGNGPDRSPVRVRPARVNAVLGTNLSTEQIVGYLEPIGFAATPAASDDAPDVTALDVTVPTFRPDTTIEVDVIEEVARHHGYANIERTLPSSVITGGLTPRQRERRAVREILVGLGLSEAMPLPFLAPGDLRDAGLDDEAITLTNPLDANESVLRPSLRPGLLKALAYNASHRNPTVRLFEIGRTFARPAAGERLPDEREMLAVALGDADAIEASRVWQVLADALALSEWELRAATPLGLHPTRSGVLLVAGDEVGAVGEVDPAVLDRFDIPGRVGWLELDLGRLLDLPHGERTYRKVSLYPSSDIDLAFEVDQAVPASAVEATVRRSGAPLVVAADLFDVFRGGQIADGRRSLAFALRLQAPDRTLADDEIAGVRQAIIDAVEAEHGAVLRG
jgi:phenylalanyl-tRNA synthetase beta chain